MRLLSTVETDYGIEVPLHELLISPTIERLVEIIEEATAAA